MPLLHLLTEVDLRRRVDLSVKAIRLSCLLLAVSVLGADLPPDAPDPSWRTGPVRYLLVVREDQEYKTLKTDEERAAFIEKFWAGIDPTPGTPENERREEFWKRVEEANRLFREAMIPGWRTDRGKFYVLLGPPEERRQEGSYEVWKYVALPNPDADPEVMVRFHRNTEGKFHVGFTKLEYWDPSQKSDGPAAGETFLGVRTKGGSLEMMKGRLRMTEFPPAAVQANFSTASLQCQLRYDFYRARQNSTRVVVTLAASRDQFRAGNGEVQIPSLTLSVAVDDARKGKPVGSFSAPMQVVGGVSGPEARPLLVQGAFTIEPGTYKAAINIVDTMSHRGLTRREMLDVPDFGRALAISSVALGRLRDEPQATTGAGGQTGAPAMVPEPDSTFRSEDTILIAYEVYNASHGGGTKLDLDVMYQFFFITEAGPRQVAQPALLHHQSSESLAYSLPLRGWPEGSFRLNVVVTDNLSGATTERQVDFRLSAGP